MTVRVGVVGLGMMGVTHLQSYGGVADAEVVAICDADEERLNGELRVWSNVENSEVALNLDNVRRYSDINKLLQQADIDAIDVCLPTDLHIRFGVMVLEAGKHLILEKPVARSAAEADPLVAAAAKSDKSVFIAQCIRFWPGWECVREWVTENRFGPLVSASVQRISAHPGGPFYSNAERCGGALLDLHIHDVDFVQYVFGQPTAVTSQGVTTETGSIDHVTTRYHYDNEALVMAEGIWVPASKFEFSMSYRISFRDATVAFNSNNGSVVTIYPADGEKSEESLDSAIGYDRELTYFIKCIEDGVPPQQVTLADGINAVRIAEAEKQSIQSGKTVQL